MKGVNILTKEAALRATTRLKRADEPTLNFSTVEELVQALPGEDLEDLHALIDQELIDRDLRPRAHEPWWNPDTEEWIGCGWYFDGCSCPKCEEADRRNRILRRWGGGLR